MQHIIAVFIVTVNTSSSDVVNYWCMCKFIHASALQNYHYKMHGLTKLLRKSCNICPTR